MCARCKEEMGTRKEKLSLMETTTKKCMLSLMPFFILACPRNEPPSWLSNAEWSVLKSYNHIHINKKKWAQQLFMYLHINIHTYMYICNNDTNLRKRRCQLERGRGTCLEEGYLGGPGEGNRGDDGILFQFEIYLKKKSKKSSTRLQNSPG